MYQAAIIDRVNIEDPEVIAGHINGLLEPYAFLSAVNEGKYDKAVNEANDLAYEKSGVWVVPAYRMGDRSEVICRVEELLGLSTIELT